MTFRIDYEARVQDAMRQAIRKILQDVSNEGLPGKHHFYITFKSTFPGVEMSEWLIEKYPEEMTIVIQNWFAELVVREENFTIILNFSNNPEKMTVPLNSIINFADPSVNFSLQLELYEHEESSQKPKQPAQHATEINASKKTVVPHEAKKNGKENQSKDSNIVEVKDNVIDFQSFKKPD